MSHKKYHTDEERREAKLAESRRYAERNKEKKKEYYSRPEIKSRSDERQREWRDQNRGRVNELGRLRYRTRPKVSRQQTMLNAAKQRAKVKGYDFDLILEDVTIPEFCPVLGIPLKLDNLVISDNSPTLDRKDSSKGYIKGNVFVISWRANRLKSDATAEELKAILSYSTS